MPPDFHPSPAGPDAPPGRVHPADSALLEAYSQDLDEAAFAGMVRRHLDLVYSAALRQTGGDRPQAEDVTQAVFTELARHAGRLRSHPALPGWLLTTTRRMVHTAQRAERRRRQREHASFIQEMPSGSPLSADPEPDWSAIAPVLDDALNELSERDRSAVVLRFFQSRPFNEIGDALGSTANTARMRVERALDRLRRGLVRRGIDSTSAALAAALSSHAVHAAPLGLSAAVTGIALAAASGAGVATTASLIPLMMSVKSKLLVGGLAATLMTVPLVWQRRELGRLRSGLAEARIAQESAARSEADALRAAEAAANEAGRLRGLQAELMRLRGEIGPLRDQLRAQAVASAGAASATPRSPVPPPSPAADAGRTELSDLGATTAEHAAGSLIWAVSQGRFDRLTELLELPATVRPDDAPRHYDFFARQLSNAFSGKDFDGWSMELKGTTNENVARLRYGYRDLATDKQETFVFQLHRLDSGWKVMVEGEVPENF